MESDGVEISTSKPSPAICVAVFAVSMLLSSEIALCAISSKFSTGMPIIIVEAMNFAVSSVML